MPASTIRAYSALDVSFAKLYPGAVLPVIYFNMASQHWSEEDKKHIQEFHEAVNMTAKELIDWLKTEESQTVGQKTSDDAESTGHESGRNLVQLLRKSQTQYTPDDLHEMRRVVSYVHRHMAQKPEGDISETRWRYSLMNWGHDPLKK